MDYIREMESNDPNKMSKERAAEEIIRILNDPEHPYLDIKGKATRQQREIARKYVDRLYLIKNGQTDTISGYVDEFEAEKEQLHKDQYGNADPYGKNRSSKFGVRTPESIDTTHHDIGFAGKEVKSGFGGRIEDAE